MNKSWKIVVPSGCICVVLVFIIFKLFIASGFHYAIISTRTEPYEPEALTFDNESDLLSATQIVPTLDTPLEDGKNAIWCSTIITGWKSIQKQTSNGNLIFNRSKPLCQKLNKATDPLSQLSDKEVVAYGGPVKNFSEFLNRFDKFEPIKLFKGVDGLMCLSYLEANIKFTIPYHDSFLEFLDSNGKTEIVKCFGIPENLQNKELALRKQCKILYVKSGPDKQPIEFAIDLCQKSKPNQIVVACINKMQTLEETFQSLNKKMSGPENEAGNIVFGDCSIMLVPEMAWRIVHHFKELEGGICESPPFEGQQLPLALQINHFRLDRSGASLSSLFSTTGISIEANFIFNKPFLLYMKHRKSQNPYFVMWVDNTELLRVETDNKELIIAKTITGDSVWRKQIERLNLFFSRPLRLRVQPKPYSSPDSIN